jgi:putative ABC transport system substrate-binding protein
MEKTMSRRMMVFVLSVVILSSTHLATAQQAKKIPRIGMLVPGSASAYSTRVEAFKRGLRELGYVEGKNIIIEYRYSEATPDQLPLLASKLVRLKVDVIVTASSGGINAAKKASSTMPIVFVSLRPDPVEAGFVSSLARPGGNITGLTLLAPELDGKRLEILKEAFLKFTKVAFLRRVGAGGDLAFRQAEASAKTLGLQLQPLVVSGADDFDIAFDRAKAGGAQALIATPNPLFTNYPKRIVDLAAKNRLPGMYSVRDFVEVGGLMSYGPEAHDNYRRAAVYVDKILKGAKPADLPVEQPTKFEFIINLKAAKQIGLTIPPNVLARADKVIK